ncbi:MAG: carbamoyltransferase HypF [Planctomycetia bacterium]|nr:carbamoyltransferase HypF [Planctomycetia bacterium]
MAAIVRKRIRITGVVQGVGFRPFVWRRATRLGLSGWVENDAAGVTAELQGTAAAVAAFLEGLASAAPPLARVTGIESLDVPPLADDNESRFVILGSVMAIGPRAVVMPPDIAPCEACLAEMADPGDRRHRHPFITCTDCGPRFTIIEALPYDRGATTMRSFAMCDTCAAEYCDPSSRRFHAQPNACPACGPAVWFAEGAGGAIPTIRSAARCLGPAAIEAARALLRRGGIVAIKGVGGFQLVCDATNATAVRILRDRKQRLRKPFAVMVADLAAARELAQIDEQERRLLEGCERPIVLLRPRAHPTVVDRRLGGGKSLLAAARSPTLVERSPTPFASPSSFAATTLDIDWMCSNVSAAVAPGNDFLGLMLPSSPLHHLLCHGMPPLVMTSGNLAEEPLASDNADAATRLAPLADGFLLHDRDIHVPCDDSVVRCVAGLPLPIRRSRGHAPLPVQLARGGPSVLAVGGELKAAICLAHDDQAVMSQHIGDMGNLETLEALDRAATHLMRLFDVAPAAVIADMHPGYLSTGWARDFAAARDIPLVQVQHHEAHVAALLAEHGLDVGSVPAFIGVCFDGTGYGRDGTIQGGEFFVAAGGDPHRAAHLLPFPLPGGDAAIRHPWRTALAFLREAGIPWDERLPPVGHGSAAERDLLARQLTRTVNCIATTSMGRLFDAVASLVGACHSIDYEAEAALNLEALAAAAGVESWDGRRGLTLTTATDGTVVADWRPLVAAIVDDINAGHTPATIAAAFHDAVVRMIVDVCKRLRDGGSGNLVGLSGGVFQNAILVERSLDALHAAGFEVLTHHAVPPNDGGLALGQAVLGRLMLTPRRLSSETGAATPRRRAGSVERRSGRGGS